VPSLIITRVRDQARGVRSFDLMPDSARAKHGVAFVPGQVAVLSVEAKRPRILRLRVRRKTPN